MGTYDEFLKLDIDTSLIGLEKRDEEGGYFCTPVGARVIGWESCGIHYCFLKGFGNMVFAVNPMSCVDKLVYSIAESFKTFLCLILTTKSTTALEQIVWWSKEQFEEFLVSEENPVFPEQENALCTMQKRLNLKPYPNPYAYVKEIQIKFDYDRITFSDEYYDILGLDRP